MKTSAIRIKNQIFMVELPQTSDEFARGLMFRPSLGVRNGMLFDFGIAQHISMWMKNCLIGLDMLFIRDNQILHIVHGAPPCKTDICPSYVSPEPVDMVIELPAGTAEKLGLQAGDFIQRIRQQALALPSIPLRI